MLWESTQLFFAEDQLAVDHHLKNTATTFDQADFYTILFIQIGRQTGGLWGVVSLYAILNADIHRLIPFFKTQHIFLGQITRSMQPQKRIP